MNIKALFCLVVLIGFHNQALCGTNLTLVVTSGSTSLTNVASFNVNTGQVAKIVYAYLGASSVLWVSVNGTQIAHFNNTDLTTNSRLPVVVGPAQISLYFFGFCTIEVSNPGDSFVPSNTVVIPSDSDGPVNIILESSADLINWYPSLPGMYGANYTNRFFRVRSQLTQ